MNQLSRRLINEWQGGFPLCERPFAQLGTHLDASEDEVLATLRQLLADGTLTRFGPLYQIERLGGAFSLAALSAPAAEFERIAAIVNAFPEVAHNYQRNHALNMWFVLATETLEALQETLQRISAATNLPVYNFPKQREYCIEARFQVGAATPMPKTAAPTTTPYLAISQQRLQALRPLLLATQAGLPLDLQPYHRLAAQLNVAVEQVLADLQFLLAAGAIRRIGLVPNHYRLGYTANGMTVWDVADALIDELGEQVGALEFVTHCYRRPRQLPSWRYNLFAMVHGADRAQVERQTAQIAAILGAHCAAHDVLYSSKILKKTGLRLRS